MSACTSLRQAPLSLQGHTEQQQDGSVAPCTLVPGSEIYFDNHDRKRTLNKSFPPVCTELIDTATWVKRYGLRANKLTYQHILSMIGFKQMQDYTDTLKKNITSKYGKGLFIKTQTNDGTVYNITVESSRLADFELRLEEAINLYESRLRWLNSDSRRLFGVLQERHICLVLDCKQKNANEFHQFKNSVLNLLFEQVLRLATFNIVLIMCDQSYEIFKQHAVPVSVQSVEEAVEWLNNTCHCHLTRNKNCDRCSQNRKFTETSACEGTLRALQDDSLEAVYLISEGISSNGLREILYDKLVKESFKKRIKLNIVSYNCSDVGTLDYLKRIAVNSFGPGRFHAYCLLKMVDDFAPGPICSGPTKSNVAVNKLAFGGAPPGSGTNAEIMPLFDEIQEAKEALGNLKIIIRDMNDQNTEKQNGVVAASMPMLPQRRRLNRSSKRDEYMTSKEWLSIYGLCAKKLDLFEQLKGVCFKHCDGVVDVKQEPNSGQLVSFGDGKQYYKGDAIPREKLVNARYCDQFAHVLWHDGTIVHVHVTPDLHRNYEKRIQIAMEQYQKRIDWLSKGSRELFGTITENNICILIDTSQSMQVSLDFVKQKLCILIAEQLKSKTRFNLVAFNSRVTPWRDRMVEVDEYNMNCAVDWINSLSAQGTTNTLGAIRFALNDLNTEAIYLLSDGRPDQEPKQILSQISLNTKIPIHTISFNCNDKQANAFLNELSFETHGRFHYFNEHGWVTNPDGSIPYQSEDTLLLREEIQKAIRYLSQVAHLREECIRITTGKKPDFEIQSRTDIIKSDSYKYCDLCKDDEKSTLKSYESKGVEGTLKDIQTLDWVLPETRLLLEKQFRSELNGSKRCSKFHKECLCCHKQPGKVEVKAKRIKSVPRKVERKPSPPRVTAPPRKVPSLTFSDDEETTRSIKEEFVQKLMNKPKEKDESRWSRGTRVIARNDVLGYYYAGQIIKVLDSSTVNVRFENGCEQRELSTRFIIRKADPSAYLSVGDYVMASVINEYNERCWVPGIIQTKLIQIDAHAHPKLYMVLYFNGQEGNNCRQELVKISKHFYGTAVNYIRSKLGLGTHVRDEEVVREKSPEKEPAVVVAPPAPDLTDLKGEILDEIKMYFDALKLDSKYEDMFAEFLQMKKNHKKLKSNLVDRLEIIRTDFEEWKNKEPKVVKIIEERQPIYNKEVVRIERQKATPPPTPPPKPRTPSPILVPEPEPEPKPKKEKKRKSYENTVFVEPLNRKTITTITTPRSSHSLNSSNASSSTRTVEKVIEMSYEHLVAGLRRKLSNLEIGEHVLAKFPEDGWYYNSTIVEGLGDGKYRIDSDGSKEYQVIFREDLISLRRDAVDSAEAGDTIVALHPNYENSYAPGQILKVSSDMGRIIVKFYDYVEAVVDIRDIFSLNHIKYQADVEIINHLEMEKVGKNVVARNPLTKVYELGRIVKRVGKIGQQYVIEWPSGEQSIQNSNHIFTPSLRRPVIKKNDYVLAPKSGVFLPAICLDRHKNRLELKFFDGEEDGKVDPQHCYWLSKDYYKDVCKFVRRELNSESDSSARRRGKMEVTVKEQKTVSYRKASVRSETSSNSEEDSEKEVNGNKARVEMESRRSSKSSAN